MGVSIMWRPRNPLKSKDVGFGARSKAHKILTEHFGGVLTEKNIKELRAMTLASNEEGYSELADAVEEYGEIEVWGEF